MFTGLITQPTVSKPYSSVSPGSPQHVTIYDTIRKKSLTWTQKLSDQLNLAHVARKKYEKETKINNTICKHI